MISLASFFAGFSIFTSSVFSASVSSTYQPSLSPLVYLASQNIDWANGTIYDAQGHVVIQTESTGKNTYFRGTDGQASSIPSPTHLCGNQMNSTDSLSVDFNFKKTVDGFYTWSFQQPGSPMFLWHPKSASHMAEIPIPGYVTKKGYTKSLGTILMDQTDGLSPHVIPGPVFRIELENPPNDAVTPTYFELVELLYLQTLRARNCFILT